MITDMNQPLGNAVGNSLEVREAIQVLKGQGPEDITRLSVELAGMMIYMGEHADTPKEGVEKAVHALESGAGLAKFREYVAGQGGDPAVTENDSLLPLSEYVETVTASRDGFVTGLDAMQIGLASQHTGAGRETKEDSIDHGAGILLQRKIGDPVKAGEALCTVFSAEKKKLASASDEAAKDFQIGDKKPEIPELIHRVID